MWVTKLWWGRIQQSGWRKKKKKKETDFVSCSNWTQFTFLLPDIIQPQKDEWGGPQLTKPLETFPSPSARGIKQEACCSVVYKSTGIIADRFLQRKRTWQLENQIQQRPNQFDSFIASIYITYLYILSIGALDRWSSPKGVLEIGRTTPKTKIVWI